MGGGIKMNSFKSYVGPNTRSGVTTRDYYHALRNTTAACFLDVSQFPSSLLASKDFVRTIKTPPGSHFVADAFQRPVRWVLTSRKNAADDVTPQLRMMIISPYEANCLMSQIRKSRVVTLHLYAPRQSRGFPSLDRLTLYTNPTMLPNPKYLMKSVCCSTCPLGSSILNHIPSTKTCVNFWGWHLWKRRPALLLPRMYSSNEVSREPGGGSARARSSSLGF